MISHQELDERCKCYILLESIDVNKLTTVLQSELKTLNFKVMPDNSVRLYDFLNEREKIGQTLYDNGVVVTQLAVYDTNLEEYFMDVIGGKENA